VATTTRPVDALHAELQMLDGGTGGLDTYRGKPLVVNFWRRPQVRGHL
jgi:hypothetical protein